MHGLKPTVLLVDDEPNITKTMRICLQELDLEIHSFNKPRKALAAIRESGFDLAFIDLKMSPINGMELLEEIQKTSPDTTVVIITAHGSVETAVEAIKKGAYDYLQKPFDFVELQILAVKVLEHHRLKLEVRSLKTQLDEIHSRQEIITRNKKMQEMIELANRIAPSGLSVLIEGESGTGKELFAQLLHNRSERSDKPFVKVNCAALPENLLESELFGHIKGAFTGAIKDRKGRFEAADGGTIFLDEIAELTPALQVKLLRILQEKEYERLGESHSRSVNVRVLSATNKNIDEAIKEGAFREDLFYRLNSIRLRLSPLRERPEDIPLLIQHFLNKYQNTSSLQITPEAMQALRAYRWNGNVRELENVVERAVVLAHNHEIKYSDLPDEIQEPQLVNSKPLSLEEIEKVHLKRVLQFSKDLKEAADILGIDQATLWRKRKKYFI